jgi:hypothetical protein
MVRISSLDVVNQMLARRRLVEGVPEGTSAHRKARQCLSELFEKLD